MSNDPLLEPKKIQIWEEMEDGDPRKPLERRFVLLQLIHEVDLTQLENVLQRKLEIDRELWMPKQEDDKPDV